MLPPDLSIESATLFQITLPSVRPPISQSGGYLFAIAAAQAGTADLISNLATASFAVK